MNTSDVEVLDLVTGEPGTKVRAIASVKLGGVVLHNVRLVEGKKGLFVGLPSRKVPDTDTWRPLVELSDRLRDAVLAAVVEALRTPLAGSDFPF